MSTLTSITGKELEREINNNGDKFCWKKNMKKKKIAAVRRFEMLAATKLKWAAVKKQSDRYDRRDRWNFVFSQRS